MLQNRVDPWGNIIKTSARGSWMGNRGLLHDEHQNIRRPFRLQAWLICLLEFKGRKRPVMAPRQYTELFFMDEATAFSAGHRPCFECRRKDFDRFKTLWIKANPEYGFDEKTYIRKIDEVLHRERIDHNGSKITYISILKDLPDGAFVVYKDQPAVVAGSSIYPWTPSGYGKGIQLPKEERLTVLTPKSVVKVFRSGYIPHIAL
ncbi:MAG TPA: hypothetical protein VL727_24260 [Puia sp.]|nr:hypothetical protein [Puia sp.]